MNIDRERFEEIIWSGDTQCVYDLAPESPDDEGRTILRRIWKDGTIERGHWIDDQFVILENGNSE